MNGDEGKNGFGVQLARIEGKIDTLDGRVKDVNGRMDRLERQRDLDRVEFQAMGAQVAAVAAACPLHSKRLDDAISNAVDAQQTAARIESSWNDLRPDHLKSRSHSDQYKSVKAVETEIESKVALAVVRALDERRTAERQEKKEAEDHALKLAEDRRKRASWFVGLAISVLGALGGGSVITLWKQIREERTRSREDRAATVRALESKLDESMRTVIVKMPTLPVPVKVHPEKKGQRD